MGCSLTPGPSKCCVGRFECEKHNADYRRLTRIWTVSSARLGSEPSEQERVHVRPLTVPGAMHSCGTRPQDDESTCRDILSAGGASQLGLPANLSGTGASIPVDSPSVADITPSECPRRSGSLPLIHAVLAYWKVSDSIASALVSQPGHREAP